MHDAKHKRRCRQAAAFGFCVSDACGAFPDACGATLPYSTVDPIADAHGIQGRATKAAMILQTAVGMGGS